MNIHTQSSCEAFVDQLQEAVQTAPKLPIAYVDGRKVYPGAVLREWNEGKEIDPRVFTILRTKYSASLSLAA